MDKKSDKAAFFIKTAIRVLFGVLIVAVFIRNAFPDVKQAVVLENAVVSPENSSSEIAVSSTESVSSSSSVPDRFIPAESSENAENPESSAVLLPVGRRKSAPASKTRSS